MIGKELFGQMKIKPIDMDQMEGIGCGKRGEKCFQQDNPTNCETWRRKYYDLVKLWLWRGRKYCKDRGKGE